MELILVVIGLIAALCLLVWPRRCSNCGEPIPRGESWPDGRDGWLCQDCWEEETGRQWSELFTESKK